MTGSPSSRDDSAPIPIRWEPCVKSIERTSTVACAGDSAWRRGHHTTFHLIASDRRPPAARRKADPVFTRSARFYDLLYAQKDYRMAAAKLRDLIGREAPKAATLLDVGCGTGQHLAHLREHYSVEGLDLDSGLLAVARERLPGVPLHKADMAAFDLGRRF